MRLFNFTYFYPALFITSILLLGLILRFLYFPNNIYFGYDQARDAFLSQEILQGKFKVVGPTTSAEGFSHGALFYYLFAPIYFLGQGDPTALSIFLRIYNAFGVLLVFLITKNLFNKKAAFISALLYTFSYEQTQYAIYMTHPTLAVIPVLLFYYGLTLLFFKSNKYGLFWTALGFGLAFQFHFVLINLFLIFLILSAFFWKKTPRINFKTALLSLITLFATLSTYILAEIKYNFKTFHLLFSLISGDKKISEIQQSPLINLYSSYLPALQRFTTDNFFAIKELSFVVLIVFGILAIYFLRYKDYRNQIIFLMVWFLIGASPYLIANTSLYFYAIGASIGLIVFSAFLLNKLLTFNKVIFGLILLIILASNSYLIFKNNPFGPNPELNVQTGMLLSEEKKAINYIYKKADQREFAVNALTMPLFINTTWSYLFEWYGQKEYHVLPVWGGKVAAGYPGNLKINNSRSTLPHERFLIVEPTRGIENRVKDYLTEEGYFTNILEERNFGDIVVKYQNPK